MASQHTSHNGVPTYNAVRIRPGQKLEAEQSAAMHFTRDMKVEYTKRICAIYASGKYTLEQCCKEYGIGISRLRKWCMPHLDVEQMILDGEELPKSFVMECRELYAEAKTKNMFNAKEILTDLTKVGLMQRVKGFETEEYTAERMVDTRPMLDDGSENPNFGQMVTVKEKVKRYNVAPDTSALIFVATNVMPETFKHRNAIDHSGNVNLTNSGLESLTDTQLKQKREELEYRNRKLQEARTKKTA